MDTMDQVSGSESTSERSHEGNQEEIEEEYYDGEILLMEEGNLTTPPLSSPAADNEPSTALPLPPPPPPPPPPPLGTVLLPTIGQPLPPLAVPGIVQLPQFTIYPGQNHPAIPPVQGPPSELVYVSPNPGSQTYLRACSRPLGLSFRPWEVRVLLEKPRAFLPISSRRVSAFDSESELLQPLTPEQLCSLTEYSLFEQHKRFLTVANTKEAWVRNAEGWIEDVWSGVDMEALDRGGEKKLNTKRQKNLYGNSREKLGQLIVELNVIDKELGEEVKSLEANGETRNGKGEGTKTSAMAEEVKCFGKDFKDAYSDAVDNQDVYDLGDEGSRLERLIDPSAALHNIENTMPVYPSEGPSKSLEGCSLENANTTPTPSSSKPVPTSLESPSSANLHLASPSSSNFQLPSSSNNPVNKFKPKRNPALITENALLNSVGMYKTSDGKLWRWPGQRDMRYGEDLHLPRQQVFQVSSTLQQQKVWFSGNIGESQDDVHIPDDDLNDYNNGEDNNGGIVQGGDQTVGCDNSIPKKDEGSVPVEENLEAGLGIDSPLELVPMEPDLMDFTPLASGNEPVVGEEIGSTATVGIDAQSQPSSSPLLLQTLVEGGIINPPGLYPIPRLSSFQRPRISSNQQTDGSPADRSTGFFSPTQKPLPQPAELEKLQLRYLVQQRRFKIEFAKLNAQIKVLREAIEEILGCSIAEYVRLPRNTELLQEPDGHASSIKIKTKSRRPRDRTEEAQDIANGEAKSDIEGVTNGEFESAILAAQPTISSQINASKSSGTLAKDKTDNKTQTSANSVEKSAITKSKLRSMSENQLPKLEGSVALQKEPLDDHSDSENSITSSCGYTTYDSSSSDETVASTGETPRKKLSRRFRKRKLLELRQKADVERIQQAERQFIDGFRKQIIELREYSEKHGLNPVLKKKRKRDIKGKGKASDFETDIDSYSTRINPELTPSISESSPMSTLPTEILMQILAIPRLPVKASVLGLVCKRWYEIVTPMIYSRVELGDTIEDIEHKLLERQHFRKEMAEKRAEAARKRVRKMKSTGSGVEEAEKCEVAQDIDSDSTDMLIHFREGNAVLAVMPVSIGLMSALCKPHLAKHLQRLVYRASSHTAFPNRETLSLYSGDDLTTLIKTRNAAQLTLLQLTRKAVRNFRRLEALVIEGGDVKIANALLAALKWSPNLKMLHLISLNIRELQFVRGKGSLWWDHQAKKPLQPAVGQDEKQLKSASKVQKPDDAQEQDGKQSKADDPPTVSTSEPQEDPRNKESNAEEDERYMGGARQTPHLSTLHDYEAGFSYALEVLSIYRCGYHLTREKHTRKVNRKGIIQVAEEEELKASAHLIPLLRRCKNLKSLRIESSHMEPEAVLGSWTVINLEDEVNKEEEAPLSLSEGGIEDSGGDQKSELVMPGTIEKTANLVLGEELVPRSTASESANLTLGQGNCQTTKIVDEEPAGNISEPTSQESAAGEGIEVTTTTDSEEGRVYLNFPKLESLTLRGCGFFRCSETPPTWISSRGYERFFLSHRIKRLAWSGWILNRHLKLNNPTFVRVARHLGETLTSLSITHFYDDMAAKVTILPSEAHGVKFAMDRFLALLSHLKSLESLEWKLLRVKMRDVLQVARILKNNKMRKLSVLNVYGFIGVEEAKELVECLPGVKQLLLKWLLYPEDEHAKQVFRREEEEELAAAEAAEQQDDLLLVALTGQPPQFEPQATPPVTDPAANNPPSSNPSGTLAVTGPPPNTAQMLPLQSPPETQPVQGKELFSSVTQLAGALAPLTNLRSAIVNFIYPRPDIFLSTVDSDLNSFLSFPPVRRNTFERHRRRPSTEDHLYEIAKVEFCLAIRSAVIAFLTQQREGTNGEKAFPNLRMLTIGYFINDHWMNVPVYFVPASKSSGKPDPRPMARENARKCVAWYVEQSALRTGLVNWLAKKLGKLPWDGKTPLLPATGDERQSQKMEDHRATKGRKKSRQERQKEWSKMVSGHYAIYEEFGGDGI